MKGKHISLIIAAAAMLAGCTSAETTQDTNPSAPGAAQESAATTAATDVTTDAANEITTEENTQTEAPQTEESSDSAADTAAPEQNEVSSQSSVSIVEEAARDAALKHAGVSLDDVSFIRINRELDDGIDKYEVDFYVGNTEYDYDINAITGEIISYDSEIELDFNKPAESKAEGTPVSEIQARRIAFENSGVKEQDVSFINVKKDFDDGISKYEVEFYVNNTEYDYEINADTGEIISFDQDIENDFNVPNTSTGGDIDEEKAKSIALARVSGAAEKDIRIHGEYDDGEYVYEGSIVYGDMEYEFKISGTDGSILEWEAESIYDD